ncbi:hypothetical protein D3C78_1608290 [compost metagenome]
MVQQVEGVIAHVVGDGVDAVAEDLLAKGRPDHQHAEGVNITVTAELVIVFSQKLV